MMFRGSQYVRSQFLAEFFSREPRKYNHNDNNNQMAIPTPKAGYQPGLYGIKGILGSGG